MPERHESGVPTIPEEEEIGGSHPEDNEVQPMDSDEEYERRTPEPAKEYTEEELKNRLKDIKDIEEFKKAISEIIGSMESQFFTLMQKYDEDAYQMYPYEWIASIGDEWGPDEMSIFEKKWLEIYEKVQAVLKDVEEWNAEANLLTFFDQIGSELFNLQNYAKTTYEEDMKDWVTSNKEFVTMGWLSNYYSTWWEILFSDHNYDMKEFKEKMKTKPMSSLIWEVFSITSWAWAFNDWLAEIKRRLNWKNLFQEIEDLTSDEAHDREKDWTADTLEWKAITWLLKNGKIEDFDNYLKTYKDAERIKANIKKYLRNSMVDWMQSFLPWYEDGEEEDFLWIFLAHFEEVKKTSMLWDIARELEQTSPIVREFSKMEKEIHTKELDIIKEWKINWLLLFDKDFLAWSWAEYYQPNINKYKALGYKQVETQNTEDMSLVTLKKWNDRLTFVLLKESSDSKRVESYERALNQIKDNGYNLIALRWHCYDTEEMAPILWKKWIVKEWSILIDGWCWNSKQLEKYVNAWVTCPIFSYTDTWKWATTEALFDLIIKEKDKWGNLGTLLETVQNASNQKSPKLQRLKTMNMPDSVHSLYALSKWKANRGMNWSSAEDVAIDNIWESWNNEVALNNSEAQDNNS